MFTHPADHSTAPQTTLGPFSSPGAGPTPWEATEWALRRIQKFQLCTVRRDGRPHVTLLLAIWALGAMWFTTGDKEQKAKNLSANQHCVLTTGTNTLTGTQAPLWAVHQLRMAIFEGLLPRLRARGIVVAY